MDKSEGEVPVLPAFPEVMERNAPARREIPSSKYF
jgi:hypothetical protein